jgi:hypothetical protein
MGLKMLTPYQALSHKGLNLPLSFALFPPLLLDPLTTLPQVIPDPHTVQHHIDYDQNHLFDDFHAKSDKLVASQTHVNKIM